ncbi:PqqD family peptide modification chaperone [Candidatus Eisenbacteria bacterium]|uniref:PqqD family peptide modification chaperone n=1 Tax=Eiseniibacteriota bacterium TaxID=2212470 RepID=A0ABV6YIS3_UNCEI
MTTFESSHIPEIPPGLIHKQRDSQHLLLHPTRPRWAMTNQLGREIIDLCDGHHTIASIASALARKYGQTQARVERDVVEFITDLERARLLASDSAECSESMPRSGISSVFLHVTDRCNLTCAHCYVDTHDSVELELSTQQIHRLIDDLACMGGTSVTFSGGEPLLRPDCLELLRYAGEQLTVTLNTNATLIDSSVAGQLASINPLVQVSVDGPDPETHDGIRGNGSFEATMQGLRCLHAQGLGPRLVIATTLMKQNIARAPEMIDLATRLGVSRLRFLPLHRQGRAGSAWSTLDASLDEYVEWFRYVYYDNEAQTCPVEISGGLTGMAMYPSSNSETPWCSIGKTLVVDAHGNVYPCALMVDQRFLLGNVTQVGLEEITASEQLRELTQTCRARKEKIETCRDCDWRNLCQGSCAALVFLEKGTLWAADSYCEFRRQLYEDLVFKMGKARARTQDS